jgi:hypothetical protein
VGRSAAAAAAVRVYLWRRRRRRSSEIMEGDKNLPPGMDQF